MKHDKELAKARIKTELAVGDTYVDEPVYEDTTVYVGTEPMVGKTVRYYQRVPLRWVKPK